MTKHKGLLLAAALLASGCAELSQVDLGAITGQAQAPLSEDTVASGLRDALRVGTQRAADSLSVTGGFSDDRLLRIGLPDEYTRIASTLRSAGMGGPVDELELTMNRAAETAAGEATPVFASAISSISVSDAFGILNGAPDAATRYFEAKTSDELRSRFRPVVSDAMSRVGVYTALQQVTTLYETIPLAKPPMTDMSAWVTDGALQGLFSTLAVEEKKIRDDPSARSTALLRRVFADASR